MKYLIALFLIGTLFSCDKNQNTVKLLEGKWSLEKTISFENTGQVETAVVNNNEYIYEFFFCNNRHNEYCSVTYLFKQQGEIKAVEHSVYKIISDGLRIEFKTHTSADEILRSYEIKELTETQLIFEEFINEVGVQYVFNRI